MPLFASLIFNFHLFFSGWNVQRKKSGRKKFISEEQSYMVKSLLFYEKKVLLSGVGWVFDDKFFREGAFWVEIKKLYQFNPRHNTSYKSTHPPSFILFSLSIEINVKALVLLNLFLHLLNLHLTTKKKAWGKKNFYVWDMKRKSKSFCNDCFIFRKQAKHSVITRFTSKSLPPINDAIKLHNNNDINVDFRKTTSDLMIVSE